MRVDLPGASFGNSCQYCLHFLFHTPHVGKYTAHIYTVFLYTSHCWAPNDLAMVRWICNVRLKECISTDSLLEKFGINNIQTLQYLRWFGHAAKNDGCINSITALEVDDHRGGGRPK